MSQEYALFTGCFIPAKMPQFEKASVEVLEKLGIKPEYVEFTCCPNTHLKSVNKKSWLAIAARNLAVAEKKGLDIIALCPGCSGTLLTARHLLEDRETREGVNEKLKRIGLEYKGEVKIFNILHVIHERMDLIRENNLVRFPLNLSVALHDGCHIQKPSHVVEYSEEMMDELVELTGCKIVDYGCRDLCCGSPMAAVDSEIGEGIAEYKLREIENKSVDIICTGCPLCYLHYDLVGKKIGVKTPIFYYPELIALAFGMHPREIGIEANTDKWKIVERLIHNKNV
jgi:heterodisulfide reductase subunit B